MNTLETKTHSTTAYQTDVPFENGIQHPLAAESCMVTMLYGACIQLGKVSIDSLSPESFIDHAAEYAYRNGTWMHSGIGRYLGELGVNFLSLDKKYMTHDFDRMLEAGRVNNPSVIDDIREIIEGTQLTGLTVLPRRLKTLFGGYVLLGMQEGVNGYNGTVQPGAQHYLEYVDSMPGLGVHVWDPDIRPHHDKDSKRPPAMTPKPEPGLYLVDGEWMSQHSNGRIITVWTDESRATVRAKADHNIQLDNGVVHDAEQLFKGIAHRPISPKNDKLGYSWFDTDSSRMLYTYGDNIKSPDRHSALDLFATKIGVDKFLLPNMGAHSNKVLVMQGGDMVSELEGVAMHPSNPEACDALIVVDPKCPILIPGADCVIYVGSALTKLGHKVIFGVHSGQVGMFGGINEKLVEKLTELDLQPGSVEILVGPGAHTIELPVEYIENYDTGVHDWSKDVIRQYVHQDGREKVIINVVASVARTLAGLGELLRRPPSIVMSNTLTDSNVWSERDMALHGAPATKSNAVAILN